MKVLVRLAVLAAVALGAPLTLAPAAGAVTDLYDQCTSQSRGSETVVICYGVDISRTTGHVRGWGYMFGSQKTVHVQIDKVNLGNGSVVLGTTAGPVNSSTGGPISVETSAAALRCGSYYEARTYYSIRWSDGVLWAGNRTQYFAVQTQPC